MISSERAAPHAICWRTSAEKRVQASRQILVPEGCPDECSGELIHQACLLTAPPPPSPPPQAHTVWDEYMSETAARYLSQKGGKMVLLAGSRHVESRTGELDIIVSGWVGSVDSGVLATTRRLFRHGSDLGRGRKAAARLWFARPIQKLDSQPCRMRVAALHRCLF